jgi:hypothetical protein
MSGIFSNPFVYFGDLEEMPESDRAARLCGSRDRRPAIADAAQ